MTNPVEQLLSVEDEPELAMQLTALSSPDLGTRMAAESVLKNGGGNVGDRTAGVLIQLLLDPRQPLEARWRAAVILGDLGNGEGTALAPPVVSALVTATADEAWEVRHSAIYALSHLRAPEGFTPLLAQVLKAFKDEQIPFVAGLGLTQINAAAGRIALEQAANHEDPAIYSVARSVLAALASREG